MENEREHLWLTIYEHVFGLILLLLLFCLEGQAESNLHNCELAVVCGAGPCEAKLELVEAAVTHVVSLADWLLTLRIMYGRDLSGSGPQTSPKYT